MNIKIMHWGEDYAIVKIGTKEFTVSIELAKSLERQIKKSKKQ
jgi:hypothetical protein